MGEPVSAHTPEPWINSHPTLHTSVNGWNLGDNDWERAKECVNACAGMRHPERDLPKLIDTLERSIPYLEDLAGGEDWKTPDEAGSILIEARWLMGMLKR